ncbi:MAG: 2-hydroxyacyl-CoA dehydratase [Clostridia bacterium]|nr:2-hydroxyacyl-CoA dehydratase [Clostridia bacterium]
MKKVLNVGLDIGSTTVKVVVLDENEKVLYSSYRRHFSDTKTAVYNLLVEVVQKYKDYSYKVCFTGSGSMSIAKVLNCKFIQEVIACKNAVKKYIPETDVAIELGGEDAKIIYFDKFIEQRMNGSCAGGTGAFLDQMATLLNTDPSGLNELAKDFKIIYPIASRCGVFAKTDVQPLINEGASRADLAVSILQAVVNQTISGLACGRPIRGKVAFLGGPLTYLPELRNRFIATLNMKDEDVIVPEEGHLLVAKGAALDAVSEAEISSAKFSEYLEILKEYKGDENPALPPLFNTIAELSEFKKRHAKFKAPRAKLEGYSGNVFLGIDAGSTTSKLVLIDDRGCILYSAYRSNEGSPLNTVSEMIKDVYQSLPKKAKIKLVGTTGYGENLIKTAINADISEIETIAHTRAANHFMPNVESIVDIGGQDMKYIRLKESTIDNIMLNEACSSGCGSFLQTFASNLNISLDDFVREAILAKTPVDLGSRCTVFMNSKIKQAQKEGANVGDISAGLSYSVVKNALQKVMKIRDTSKLGDHIIVQGGTFSNDAVLRAFELIVGKNVIRPDISGLMGAYGMALLCKDKYKSSKRIADEKSSMLSYDELKNLTFKTSHVRCQNCENHCLLSINKFSNGKSLVTGNRCEKGAGNTTSKNNNSLPNLYKYKYERTFDYVPLKEEDAKRGKIGIPRVLNMYENYPFWHTFFTELKFSVVLSEKTSRKTYEKGMESIPSESVCYPAKITHGHIMSLIDQGVDTIFYPCIPFERIEQKNAENHYNCPIVISYSEVIKNNVEDLSEKKIKFMNPFLPFETKALVEVIYGLEEFKEYNLKKSEIARAAKKAQEEYNRYRNDIQKKGEETLKYLEENNIKGIVLSGRPYHIDGEINHGIDTMITGLGMAVLTEDSVAHLSELERPLRVVDQWMYHSRLYAAADLVGRKDNLELVQLNSFGCGIDAVTTDQVEEILTSFGKMYTLIKIDEVNNLGAIRIRIRSLLAAMKKREEEGTCPISKAPTYTVNKVPFTKKMKETHTILCPQLSPVHFEFLEAAMDSSGYKLKLLRECTEKTVEVGLKYVNNDACYPSLLVIGQLIEALQSGEYDLDTTAVIISQTGGGCRATNYIGFLRKALADAGFPNVPVISFNFAGLEKMPGFKITLSMASKLIRAVIFGDLLSRLLLRNRPYEMNKGESNALYEKWVKRGRDVIRSGHGEEYKTAIQEMVNDFDKIKITNDVKPKVGVVGEILIKYHPFGNHKVVEQLEAEGAEVVLPDFMGFIKFVATSKINISDLMKIGKFKGYISRKVIDLLDAQEVYVREVLEKAKKSYREPCDIWKLRDRVGEILSIGNQTGEGWFLTAEMLELIKDDVPNIVCVQPFACLPNHVVGKGVIKSIREHYPKANIVAVDYDPGASEANQTNRIKLLMSVARDQMEETASNKKKAKGKTKIKAAK